MTISTTNSTAVFDGSGVTTVFPFTFPFKQDGDLKVYQKVVATGIITELTTGFTKSGAGNPAGGIVTFTVAPAVGIKIIVSREVALTQSTDIRNQGDFFPEVHEDAFDKLTMQIQQIAEQVDRSVKVDIAADTNPDDLIDAINLAATSADASASAAASSASAASVSAGAAATSASDAAASAVYAAANKANTDTLRIDVASASTVNLTSSAPNTRHINITGTTTITAFTVDAGQCYFVRFNAALTLTNSASLVTQTGANITTADGDTCIIRATAANVVEVLCYAKAAPALFSGEYTSAQQTLTIGGLITLAHGLGTIPKTLDYKLVCKTAEAGYSVNDVVAVSQMNDNASRGFQPYFDATNIYIRVGSVVAGGVLIKGTGASSFITAANWKLVVRAWA